MTSYQSSIRCSFLIFIKCFSWPLKSPLHPHTACYILVKGIEYHSSIYHYRVIHENLHQYCFLIFPLYSASVVMIQSLLFTILFIIFRVNKERIIK